MSGAIVGAHLRVRQWSLYLAGKDTSPFLLDSGVNSRAYTSTELNRDLSALTQLC